MGKVGKLTKLKSAITRLHSLTKLGRTNSSSSSAIVAVDTTEFSGEFNSSDHNLLPVYVGKSRRRYLLSSNIIDHPLFQELVDRSSSSSSSSSSGVCNEGGGVTSVACEVVLFEHLLWMLENSDSSMDELVEFYSY